MITVLECAGKVQSNSSDPVTPGNRIIPTLARRIFAKESAVGAWLFGSHSPLELSQ